MRSLLTMLLAAVLVLSVLPVSAFAIEENDSKFDRFLTEIGWEKQAYLDYLDSKGWSLEDFTYMDELGTPVTEEEVQSLLVEYELTREDLNKMLVEYGEIEKGEDVLDATYLIFTEELVYAIDYYTSMTPITPENLQVLVEYYEFGSVEELEEFLNGFGDSIENYEYVEDLEDQLSYYMYEDEMDFDLDGLFSQFGLTEAELHKLAEHLETLDYDDPAFEEKLTELGERMMSIGDFETADELTAEQIAEILSIFNEFQSLFQVTTQYYLVTENEKQAISAETLITTDTTNGFDLLIEVYNQQGTFLADILLTAEMFDSEIIVDTGEDVKEIEEIVSEAPENPAAVTPEKPRLYENSKTKSPVVSSTVKGGKLPKTAGNYLFNAAVGSIFVLLGIVLFRRFRVAGI